MKLLLGIVAFGVAAATFGAPASAAQRGSAPIPRITKAQATAIARHAVRHGTIVASELEAERGGSGLRYSFDIRVGAIVREVGVDAYTGAILENARQGARPD